ncbi:MAG: sulfate transporter CysZ [Gammaproteobacteria bacterium]|nr:sulfate transporter CysZ [Gammaproteobacteria bacterium]
MSVAVGTSCVREGFELAFSRALRRYVWAPVTVSFMVIVLLLSVAFSYVQAGVTWTMGYVPESLSFIETILAPLVYIIGVLVGGWMFGLVAAVVSSPFLGLLSAAAEREHFGDGPDFGEKFWASIGRTIAREMRKLGYHLPRLALTLAVSLIPILSPIAPLIWLVFGGWMVAVQFVDYAAENRGEPFAATLIALKRNRAAALGFGATTSLLLALPLLNVFVIPAAVCGGALLWRRLG